MGNVSGGGGRACDGGREDTEGFQRQGRSEGGRERERKGNGIRGRVVYGGKTVIGGGRREKSG